MSDETYHALQQNVTERWVSVRDRLRGLGIKASHNHAGQMPLESWEQLLGIVEGGSTRIVYELWREVVGHPGPKLRAPSRMARGSEEYCREMFAYFAPFTPRYAHPGTGEELPVRWWLEKVEVTERKAENGTEELDASAFQLSKPAPRSAGRSS